MKFFDNIKSLRKNIKEDLLLIEKELNKKNTSINENIDIIHSFVDIIKSDYKFSQLELIDIYEEGEKRYKYDISPGYTDKAKDGVDKYGDLIIWKEILNKVKGKRCNLVFIQNEKKLDWWQGKEKRQIAEVLIEEFNSVTLENSNFYMMNFDEFINHFANILDISGSSIYEIKQIRTIISKVKNSIDNNKDKLFHHYIEDKYFDYIQEEVDSALIGESVIGGSINEIYDLEIENISVSDVCYCIPHDIDCIEYMIYGNVYLDVSGYADEYINREYCESIKFNSRVRFNLEVNLSLDIRSNKIDISKLDRIDYIMDILEYEGITKYDAKCMNIVGNYRYEYDDCHEIYDGCDNCKDYKICPNCGMMHSSTNELCTYCEDKFLRN